MKANLTRRNFVQLAAVAGASFMAIGGLSACSKEEAEKNATKSVAADFVIVGGGVGGLGAAIRAAETGKSAIVLEKEAMVGGDSALSAGTIHAPGTKLQETQGYGGDSVNAYIEYMKLPDPQFTSQGEPLCRILYEGAVEMVDDLNARGLGFLPIEDWDTRAHNVEGAGGALIAFLKQIAIDAGVNIRTKTAAKTLVVEEGRVVGVTTAEGELYTGSAVVLATGGFTNNPEMVAEYVPDYVGVRVISSAGAEGDGLIMAQDIGAAAFALDAGEHTYFVSTESMTDMSVPPSSAPGIVVNIDGDRFHAEDSHYDTAGKLGMKQPEHRAYYVFDETIRQEYDLFEQYFDEGIVLGGSSLEELAEEIDAPGLPATVARYNEMMEAGVDEDFGRETYLAPITGPVYYAMSIEPCIYYSYGGLDIDEHAHVLDEQGTAIPGLFACGEVCASSEIREGLLYTSGLSQGYVFGRIAVDAASQEAGR
ncbi:FAD-dependent oxidoreductase [Raoultibacter phocaeensis]|uniref:FAD-dependent oxidoreductase n=1 Tax=Raoultibacter phocaeensis TaxID=2479841 RepID=UPI00111900A4|nr:FAD-dependent oxidoreductase [Raoultibacter phocaeensis]